MDACHLLFGRPWKYDNSVHHDGHANTYSFIFCGTKIVLVPTKPKGVAVPTTQTPSPAIFLSQGSFSGCYKRIWNCVRAFLFSGHQ